MGPTGTSPSAFSSPPRARASRVPPRSRSRSWGAAIVRSILNLATVVLLIYLTYFFTVYFSNRRSTPVPVAPEEAKARQQTDELRTRDREQLASYGTPNLGTSNVRIPIRRAMEVVAAESAQPAPAPSLMPAPAPAAATPVPGSAVVTTAVPTIPAPAPGSTAAPDTSPTTAPAVTPASALVAAASPSLAPAAAPHPAPAGMAPIQLYRAICITCHDTDGRGNVIRKVLTQIPDFTASQWQQTRTDADLQHSIMEGKGQFMLPMKDKLALTHTDLKELVGFVRGFRGGKQVVGPATGQAGVPALAQLPPGLVVPVLPAQPAIPTPASGPAIASAAAGSSIPASAASIVTAAPVSLLAAAPGASDPGPASPGGTEPAPTTAPVLAAPTAEPSAAALAALTTPVPLPSALTTPVASISPLQSATTPGIDAASPAKQARLRMAGEVFRANCMVCHGPDGRGSAIRVVMPPIPDFTNGEWHQARSNSQLVASVLNGKGVLMPSWQGRISPDQARDLVEFVRTFGPQRLVASTAPIGAFGTQFNKLSQQWDELEIQMKTLTAPSR